MSSRTYVTATLEPLRVCPHPGCKNRLDGHGAVTVESFDGDALTETPSRVVNGTLRDTPNWAVARAQVTKVTCSACDGDLEGYEGQPADPPTPRPRPPQTGRPRAQ